MLPNSIEPLWGIELDRSDPDRSARYLTNRSLAPAIRRQFLSMLLRDDLAQGAAEAGSTVGSIPSTK